MENTIRERVPPVGSDRPPRYMFGNTGILPTGEAKMYVQAGSILGIPISIEPTEGIDLDDKKKPVFWRVFSGKVLTPAEITTLEEKVTSLIEEENAPK